MAARRAASADFAPGIESFRGCPAASASPSSPGCGRSCGDKAQAKRFKEFKERKETGLRHQRGAVPLLGSLAADGPRAACTCSTSASGRIVDLFEGTDWELSRAEPDANCFDVSPDGRRIVFAHDPAPSAWTTAARWPRSSCAARRVATVAHDKAWDLSAPLQPGRRAHRLPRQPPGPQAHHARSQLAVLERGGRWKVVSAAWDHSLHARCAGTTTAGPVLRRRARGAQPCGASTCARAARRASSRRLGAGLRRRQRRGRGGGRRDGPPGARAPRCATASRRAAWSASTTICSPRSSSARRKSVRLRVRRATKVQMWLVYPPGFDPRKKYPCCTASTAARTRPAATPSTTAGTTQVFAAQGHVVWRQLPRLERLRLRLPRQHHAPLGRARAAGRGGRHRLAAEEALGRPAARVRHRRQLRRLHGRVDERPRVAGRYQAYVCHAGCFDWVSMFAEDAWHLVPAELGAWYWDDMAKVHAQSPHAFAGG